MEPGIAFALGWLLSAFALIHLARMVNVECRGGHARMTLAVYLFVYTPLKQQSAWNTIVGAVSGALPPLIGWAGAAGPPQDDVAYFRASLFLAPGAVYLFLLLFLWQLPHFLAINWMYRDEYRKGGFVMWANEDHEGALTARLAVLFLRAGGGAHVSAGRDRPDRRLVPGARPAGQRRSRSDGGALLQDAGPDLRKKALSFHAALPSVAAGDHRGILAAGLADSPNSIQG